MKLQQLHEGKGSSTIEFNKYVELYSNNDASKKTTEADIELLMQVGSHLIVNGFEFSMEGFFPPKQENAAFKKDRLVIQLPLVNPNGVVYKNAKSGVFLMYKNFFAQITWFKEVKIELKQLLEMDLDRVIKAINREVEGDQLKWDAEQSLKSLGLLP